MEFICLDMCCQYCQHFWPCFHYLMIHDCPNLGYQLIKHQCINSWWCTKQLLQPGSPATNAQTKSYAQTELTSFTICHFAIAAWHCTYTMNELVINNIYKKFFFKFFIWFMSVFSLSTTCWYMANTPPVNLGGMMCFKLLYAVHLVDELWPLYPFNHRWARCWSVKPWNQLQVKLAVDVEIACKWRICAICKSCRHQHTCKQLFWQTPLPLKSSLHAHSRHRWLVRSKFTLYKQSCFLWKRVRNTARVPPLITFCTEHLQPV